MIKNIEEFDYSNIKPKKFILINIFSAFFLNSFILAEFCNSLNKLNIYEPITENLFLISLFGLLLGNLLALFFFKKLKHYRLILISSEIIAFLLNICFFTGIILQKNTHNSLLTVIQWHNYFPQLFVLLLFLIFGIKICYFLKICCGRFIDNKQPVATYLAVASLAGALGLATNSIFFRNEITIIPIAIFSLISLITIFLINLPYNPQKIIAHEFSEKEEKQEKEISDDAFLNYTNIVYLIFYSYFGYLSLTTKYNNQTNLGLDFLVATFLFCAGGAFLAKIFRKIHWNFYLEFAFPLFFTIFIFLSRIFTKSLNYNLTFLLFIPVLIALGISLFYSFDKINNKFTQNKSFKILNICLLIIPLPLLLLLTQIKFSNRAYYLTTFIFMIFNLIVPNIHLFIKKANIYKKISSALIALIIIISPLVLNHYFSLPFNSSPYQVKLAGYDEIKKIDYQKNLIERSTIVTFKNQDIFALNNNRLQNIKKATVCLSLFATDNCLFFDGNQNFITNCLYNDFKNLTVVNYVPQKIIGSKKANKPETTKYQIANTSIVKFLTADQNNYNLIYDIPNLYDLQNQDFKYTKEYINLIEENLKENGFYAILLDLEKINFNRYQQICHDLDKTFEHNLVIKFSNFLLLINSDKELKLSATKMAFLNKQIKTNKHYATILYTDIQLYSYFLTDNISKLLQLSSMSTNNQIVVTNSLVAKNNLNTILSLIDQKENKFWYKKVIKDYHKNLVILEQLNQLAKAEENNRYLAEAKIIADLQKYTKFNFSLRNYLDEMSLYKNRYYLNNALLAEQTKDWEKAQILYQASLLLDKNDFAANYNLGKIYLTIQDFDQADLYLENALKLTKDKSQVFYQLGILKFSQGLINEALYSFQRASQKNHQDPQLYHYIGLCYEKQNKLLLSRDFFQKAKKLDTNDLKIQSSLLRIEEKIKKQREYWTRSQLNEQRDFEENEKILLPVNQSAINSRLNSQIDDKKK